MATMALTTAGWFSPRTWGCFLSKHVKRKSDKVFPTHVGVFPLQAVERIAAMGFPHARGGVSKRIKQCQTMGEFSPRTWGCFHHQP